MPPAALVALLAGLLVGPLVEPCRPPLGLPQKQPADPCHGKEAEGGARGSRQRGPVPHEDDGNQDAAECRPADDVARGVLEGGG